MYACRRLPCSRTVLKAQMVQLVDMERTRVVQETVCFAFAFAFGRESVQRMWAGLESARANGAQTGETSTYLQDNAELSGMQ